MKSDDFTIFKHDKLDGILANCCQLVMLGQQKDPNAFGKVAEKEFLPMQAGDVKATYADTHALEAWVGFKPYTPLKDGIEKFADWYKAYYNKS